MTLYRWSQTAASNATADASINWQEGQAPSSVNDSARAMMASAAKFRDDIAGAIVTGGTSTAYTVASYQVFDSLAHLSGQIIAFTPHTTSGATVTLNVDGLGARPLRAAPSTELLAGTLVQGTPYLALYNNADAAFYLHGFFGSNPYNVPLAAGLDYWGPTTPNSAFAFPAGQAISRTTYASLFAIIGVTYGAGDGSSTFNLPDLRGRVVAALDNMGGSAAGRLTATYFGAVSGQAATALGNIGGREFATVAQSNLPNATLGVTGSVSVTSSAGVVTATNGTPFANAGFTSGAGGPVQFLNGQSNSAAAVSSTGSLASGVTGSMNGGVAQTSMPNAQPTIVCNYIMRII